MSRPRCVGTPSTAAASVLPLRHLDRHLRHCRKPARTTSSPFDSKRGDPGRSPLLQPNDQQERDESSPTPVLAGRADRPDDPLRKRHGSGGTRRHTQRPTVPQWGRRRTLDRADGRIPLTHVRQQQDATDDQKPLSGGGIPAPGRLDPARRVQRVVPHRDRATFLPATRGVGVPDPGGDLLIASRGELNVHGGTTPSAVYLGDEGGRRETARGEYPVVVPAV